jgi:hypothetical protein
MCGIISEEKFERFKNRKWFYGNESIVHMPAESVMAVLYLMWGYFSNSVVITEGMLSQCNWQCVMYLI